MRDRVLRVRAFGLRFHDVDGARDRVYQASFAQGFPPKRGQTPDRRLSAELLQRDPALDPGKRTERRKRLPRRLALCVPHGRRHPPFRRALLPVRGFVREAEAEELGGPADRHRLQRNQQSVPGRVRRALRIRAIPVGAAVLREQRDLLPVLRLVHLPRDRHVPGVAIEARERQEQVLRLHLRARRFVSVPGFFRVRRPQHRHCRIVHDDEVLHAGPSHPDVVPKPRLHAAASVLLALAGRQREGEGRG